MESIKCHDGSEEEEREVEVVLDQIHEAVMAVLLLAVLQRETHAAHDGESTASVEQDILEVEGAGDEPGLKMSESPESEMKVYSFIRFIRFIRPRFILGNERERISSAVGCPPAKS